MVTRKPERPEIEALLEKVRGHTLTEAELRVQKISFVYGNAPMDSQITRESAERAVDRTLISLGQA
ncbi:MAG: hypothetical protein H3C51_07065 [Rubellimicrobium sp.]|nr:hypothetical protein [Rubellimicrobium sp.]